MKMNYRENLFRAWRFRNPERIPIASGLPWLNWTEHGYDPNELESIILSHPILFPNYQKETIYKNYKVLPETRPDLVKANKYKDGWGCVWETAYTGMVGAVTVHPLKDWSAFNGYQAPDPDTNDGLLTIDWNQIKESVAKAHANNDFIGFAVPHGHTFLRVQDIRSYENIIFDMADEDENFVKLLSMIEQFNIELIRRYIELSPDMIAIPEDLGMQTTPMLSPDMFRKYFKPIYMNMTRPIKEAGIIVHEHSDGFILPLIDDLIDCGGDIINMQDLVNGIDNLEKCVKGRVAIDLDIDRQSITVSGTPAEIDSHIRECVVKLGSKQGGLSLCYQPWPPTPIENMNAVFDAMEKYCTYWY
jgi:uroporphyrinogen decarboxylase